MVSSSGKAGSAGNSSSVGNSSSKSSSSSVGNSLPVASAELTPEIAPNGSSMPSRFSAKNGPASGAAYMLTTPGSPTAGGRLWSSRRSAASPR